MEEEEEGEEEEEIVEKAKEVANVKVGVLKGVKVVLELVEVVPVGVVVGSEKFHVGAGKVT